MKGKARRRVRRPAPVWKLVVADLLILAVALNVYALFHHVLPRRGQAVGLVSERSQAVSRQTVAPATATPAPTWTPEPVVSLPEATASLPEATAEPTEAPAATAEPTMEAPPSPEPVGYFGSRFAEKFTDGAVETSDGGYRSANINVSLRREIFAKSRCFVADIYVRDIACFRSVLGRDTYGKGYRETARQMARRVHSVLLVNGDYYGTHDNGIVVRNGMLYRDDPGTEWDICALYWDGTMETFSPGDFDATAEMSNGAYQVWNFGPLLLDAEGQPMKEFNTKVGGYCNPRTAVGYYEPGHYCFVVADGRSSRSRGLTMEELSQFMFQLGCKRAYNLDGGQSSQMVAMDKTVNAPYQGGRKLSDALAIVEPDEGE